MQKMKKKNSFSKTRNLRKYRLTSESRDKTRLTAKSSAKKIFKKIHFLNVEIDTSVSFYDNKRRNNSLTPIPWNVGRLTNLRRCARHAARERHSPVNR